MNKIKTLFFLISLGATLPTFSEITIDGVLDEQEWQEAKVMEEFSEIYPFTLEAAPLRTKALVYSNEEGLYIGFINNQDMDTRDRRTHRRDDLMHDFDRNTIVIDFDNKANTGYLLGVSLSDALIDYTITNENNMDGDWNGEWFAKTSEDEENWYSEFFVPWTMVPMNEQKGEKRTIGLGLSRQVRYIGKWFATQKTSLTRQKFLSQLPKIQVFKSNPTRLDFLPYAVANTDFINDDSTYDVGTEIFYNNGRGGELSATINPDFGQVESDNVVINFSPRETFYSDKRPFFTQSQSLFDVSEDWYPGFELYSIFHTRRIGDKPNYDCSRYSASEGGSEELELQCEASIKNVNDIDTAIKYTKLGETTDIGVFAAFEKDEDFSKGEDFFAFRALKKIGNQKIGYMATHNQNDLLDRSATVSAIDYQYVPTSGLKVEHVSMASNISDEDSGFGSRTMVSYRSSKEIKYLAEYYYFDENLNINDMGYMWRNDLSSYGLGFNYIKTDFPEDSNTNSQSHNFDYWDENNSDNENLNEFYTYFFRQGFKSTSSISVNIFAKAEGKDDEITRGSIVAPFLKVGSGYNFEFSYNSPSYKNGIWGYRFGLQSETDDYFAFKDSHKKINVGINFNPRDNLRFWMFLSHHSRTNWLNRISDNYYGTYDQKQTFLNLGSRWYPTNDQEFQIKLETTSYRNQKGRGWNADSSGFLVSTNEPADSINLGRLSFQIRYRYEIDPLSNFYLVYTRGGGYFFDDEAGTSKIFRTTWQEPEGNVFSAKIRYRF
jgi:hypothetical protein